MPHFSFTRLYYQLRHCLQCHRSRRQLLQLDDRALKDIGLTRSQALAEGRKPFWKPASLPYDGHR